MARQRARLKFYSWLHTAAKDLIAHKRRLSADTYEVRGSDIQEILTALGMLAEQDASSGKQMRDAWLAERKGQEHG